MSANPLMPALFIGHGSPMNTLESNRFTRAWRELGESLPRPRAILAISAHWFIAATAVTAMARPRVIHDFYGFPPELFAFDYPAPGAPEVAREIAEMVRPSGVGLDTGSWGLDHGTWSVLAHLFPQADIPVLQLSIHGGEPLDYHLALGARLAPLRERGVLVLGSGNVVHNLHRLDRSLAEEGFDWAEDFDEAVRTVMTGSPDTLPALQRHPYYELAVPSPDHFLPLAYLAGLCGQQPAVAFAQGCTLGSISMTCYGTGLPIVPSLARHGEGAALPPAEVVPPEQTNA